MLSDAVRVGGIDLVQFGEFGMGAVGHDDYLIRKHGSRKWNL
jgi:hypothetical protein